MHSFPHTYRAAATAEASGPGDAAAIDPCGTVHR